MENSTGDGAGPVPGGRCHDLSGKSGISQSWIKGVLNRHFHSFDEAAVNEVLQAVSEQGISGLGEEGSSSLESRIKKIASGIRNFGRGGRGRGGRARGRRGGRSRRGNGPSKNLRGAPAKGGGGGRGGVALSASRPSLEPKDNSGKETR